MTTVPSFDWPDREICINEHWDFFDCSAAGHDRVELQFDGDYADEFPDGDIDVWNLVKSQAAAGSIPHQRALTYLADVAPGEHALMMSDDPDNHPRCQVVLIDSWGCPRCETPMFETAGVWRCPRQSWDPYHPGHAAVTS